MNGGPWFNNYNFLKFWKNQKNFTKLRNELVKFWENVEKSKKNSQIVMGKKIVNFFESKLMKLPNPLLKRILR